MEKDFTEKEREKWLTTRSIEAKAQASAWDGILEVENSRKTKYFNLSSGMIAMSV